MIIINSHYEYHQVAEEKKNTFFVQIDHNVVIQRNKFLGFLIYDVHKKLMQDIICLCYERLINSSNLIFIYWLRNLNNRIMWRNT